MIGINKLIRDFFGVLDPMAVQVPQPTRHVEQTMVDLRMGDTGYAMAEFWVGKVVYDAWGTPWATGRHHWHKIRLNRDGTTNETYLYKTEWKYKSGPPLTWGEAPDKPFDRLWIAVDPDCPPLLPKDTMIDVMTRRGTSFLNTTSSSCFWGHCGGGDDIISYRLAQVMP